ISASNQPRLDEFAEKVIPAFIEIWDDAPEQHEAMLTLLRDVGHPAAAPLWNRTLPLDGSVETRKKAILALEGIKRARASESADAVIEEFKKLLDDCVGALR